METPNGANDVMLPAGFGERWVKAMIATFATVSDRLGDLDRQTGDGDFGNNIASAFARVEREVETEQPSTYHQWLTAVSRGFLGTGGTSGPLFGMFYREVARCASDGEPTLRELAAGLSAGQATVQRYGRAEVGHKTMVDALAPATQALSGSGSDLTSTTALEAAAASAVEGARSTAAIIAKRGRASYVGEISRGIPDPGAIAMALMIQAAAAAAAGGSGQADSTWVAVLGDQQP